MKKVVVTGSESTGKTELARRLGDHYGAPVAPEYVRQRALSDPDKLGWEYQLEIAKGQIAGEDEAIARGRDLVILDTDLLSTAAYAEHYFGRCPPWIAEQATRRAADLYLLLEADIPWIPDGVRDLGERRDDVQRAIAGKLDALGARYVRVSGDRDARFAAARQAIDSVLDGASI